MYLGEYLLIRSSMCSHSDRFGSVRDLGRSPVGCSYLSGISEGRSPRWLPAWLPNDGVADRFARADRPFFRRSGRQVDADRTSVVKRRRSLLLAVCCCCCCQAGQTPIKTTEQTRSAGLGFPWQAAQGRNPPVCVR